jgi:hypothetical protein
MVPQTTAILEPFAHLRASMDRIEAFGHGRITEIPWQRGNHAAGLPCACDTDVLEGHLRSDQSTCW